MAAKKENQLLNLLINIIIPTVILIKLSGSAYLGPVWGLIVALLFPIGYGVWDYLTNKEANLFSIIGLISIFLTGGIGLLKIPAQWLAVKEAGVPLLLGILLLVFRHKYPFVEKLLHEAIDYQKAHAVIAEKNRIAELRRLVDRGTYLVAASFLLSSVLNFILARLIVTSEPGTEAFTQELGKLTGLSYPVIALPSMLVLVIALYYVLSGLSRLTDMDLEELLISKKRRE